MSTFQPPKRITRLKALMLVVAASGLSMGNESCEKAGTRALRMDVELGAVQGRTVRLPSGEVVDFPFVVNSLFYRQVMNSPYLLIMSSTGNPILGGASRASAQSQALLPPELMGYSKKDIELLQRSRLIARDSTGTLRSLNSTAGRASSMADDPNDANIPTCLFNAPMGKIAGEVVAFEATWGVGAGIGYNEQGPAVIPGVSGAKVDFSQSRLELGLRWEDPFRPGAPIASAGGIAHQSNVKFGIDFAAPLGLNFFFNTPLAEVIKAAIDRGLATLATKYIEKNAGVGRTWQEAWESRVMYAPEIADNDNLIAFRGGTYAGISRGDKFTVSNMRYLWKGKACESSLDWKIPDIEPVAELEVLQVGDVVTIAKATYLKEQRIRPGAQVKFTSFAPQPKTSKTATAAQR